MRNIITTASFKLETIRRQNRESLANEALSLIAMLYGTLITDGKKTISDYKSMTGNAINRELKIRTMMLEAERKSREEKITNNSKQREIQLLEQLKSLQ